MTTASEEWQSLMGQDLVLKTLEPAPNHAPEVAVQDVVRISLRGWAAPTRNDVDHSNDNVIFHESDDWWVQVGQGRGLDVVPAVEMAVRFMHVGETAVVWSHSKYAYGTATRTHNNYTLPSETNVAYRITVQQVVHMEEGTTTSTPTSGGSSSSSTDHNHTSYDAILRLAQARKRQANDMYQYEWSAGAGQARILQAYQRVAQDVVSLYQKGDDAVVATIPTAVQDTARQLHVDVLNNITAVLLSAKQYHAAKEAAVQVLQVDPHNFKALVRAAKAALLDPASTFDEVQAALTAAAEQAETSGTTAEDVQQLQAIFTKRKALYDQKTKQMYRKAFASKGSGDGGSTANMDKDDDPTTPSEHAAAATTTTDTAGTNAKSTSATTNNDTTTGTTSPWREWMWQKGIPYATQIVIFLSMLAYVAYHKPTTVETTTTTTVQEEF